MVQNENSTQKTTKDVMELLSAGGFARIGEAVQLLINAAMLEERQYFMRAQPYERTPERTSVANGFKCKKLKTRLGELTFKVPQTRDGRFYPSCLEKGCRSERALRAAVAQMYIDGVSTRKVAHIVQEFAGFELSSTTVSNAMAELDGLFAQWRSRPLKHFDYVFVDARYEKVRHGGAVLSHGVLLGVGITRKGEREVLGVSVALSEAKQHWKTFLADLQSRGLQADLFVSDNHLGIKAALRDSYPTVPWQRCQFHLQQTARSYIPRKDWRSAVHADIRHVFDSGDRNKAGERLAQVCEKWRLKAPRLSEWMAANIPEGFTVFDFPEPHWRRIRTSNPIERINREIRRRTRVVSIFPNESSCLRLVTALAHEFDEAARKMRPHFQ